MVVPEGSKVEILGGRIYVSAAPMPKHVLIAHEIMEQLMKRFSGTDRCATTAGAAVGVDIRKGDFVIPDVVLTTRSALRVDRPMLPVEDVEFVAEVVSKGSIEKDVEILPTLYAEWGMPIYLLVDSRTGDIILYSEPVAGVYRQQVPFHFGDTVALPSPLADIQIETAEFPRYASIRGV
nr:Uma2 family endonuclease [Streptomonospora sp. PA3]